MCYPFINSNTDINILEYSGNWLTYLILFSYILARDLCYKKDIHLELHLGLWTWSLSKFL